MPQCVAVGVAVLSSFCEIGGRPTQYGVWVLRHPACVAARSIKCRYPAAEDHAQAWNLWWLHVCCARKPQARCVQETYLVSVLCSTSVYRSSATVVNSFSCANCSRAPSAYKTSRQELMLICTAIPTNVKHRMCTPKCLA